MRIDVHGHVSAPEGLYAYKSSLLAHRGAHGRGGVKLSDDQLRAANEQGGGSFGPKSHLQLLDEAGVDLQLISPRPFQMMHSESPATLVQWWTEEVNNVIHRVCTLYPTRFKGIAGLPQSPELSVKDWTTELRRCVTELGFVGAVLNSDPYEGLQTPKGLGDRYWYPLYEVLCELDVPAYIHSASCRPPSRETYSLHFIQEETVSIIGLVNSAVFRDFPTLKVVVSHGGGAIPYQVGRFMVGDARGGHAPFMDRLRQLWFDTCLYAQDSVELLLKTVGVDRCLFGTEKPGTGTPINPKTGYAFDDVHRSIENIGWLSDADRRALFAGNAQSLFKL